MILHGDDDECFSGLTESQVKKAPKQLRHVLKALKIVSDVHENEDDIAWRDACEKVSDVLLSKCCGRAIDFGA